MEVTVNQQPLIVPDDCSLHILLREILQQPARGMAIAINDHIVPRSYWEQQALQSGDDILLIKATQGG